MSLVCCMLLAGLGQPQEPTQEPPPPPAAATLIARFDRLSRDRRNTVVRNMERRIQRLDDDIVQSVMGFERGIASYPMRSQPQWFLPRDYAPVAAKRHLIASGSSAHDKAVRNMRPLLFLPDMHTTISYDWLQGKAANTGRSLDDGQRFANYARGYLPGADHAAAQILELLDQDPEQRRLGAYFEHLYADRMGGVYADVSMFAAWNAGVIVEMPDTDAIAYARLILATQSFVAPLPADRRRTRLYGKVKQGFASHREYRSLRIAAAASFLVADPELDPVYAPLVRRCHWLWIQTGRDPGRFAERVARSADRTEFLREIDAAIESAPEIVSGHLESLRAIHAWLRALADKELLAAGG